MTTRRALLRSWLELFEASGEQGVSLDEVVAVMIQESGPGSFWKPAGTLMFVAWKKTDNELRQARAVTE